MTSRERLTTVKRQLGDAFELIEINSSSMARTSLDCRQERPCRQTTTI
jgi:hypothetical protein